MRTIARVNLRAEVERWALVAPFRVSGHVWEFLDVLVVALEKEGLVGCGEAAGIFYRNEGPTSMLREVENLRGAIEHEISRDSVGRLLASGGARNALDCALWDLEAQLTNEAAWQMAGIAKPRPLLTTFTCGADTPDKMAETARAYRNARAIKLKLTGQGVDAERVRVVRQALPEAWIGIDGNQGFTLESLEQLMPTLIEAKVALIEQPFPVGKDAWLDRLESPIPIAADESAESLCDIQRLGDRFDVINVKLDKCGGLTEALAIVKAAHALGLDAMVGNMLGTSLAMAPAFLVGQLCEVVDLDGPVLLASDRPHPVEYRDGHISCPEQLWGSRRGAVREAE